MQPEKNDRLSSVTIGLCALSAMLLYGISGGVRGDIGILLKPLMDSSGCSYQDVSFAIAVMQLSFGFFQPLFGLMAVRFSNRSVLMMGVCLYVAGLASLPFLKSVAGLLTAIGILIGAGAGAISFGIILSAVVTAVGEKYGTMISGFINAAAGLGSTILASTLQSTLTRSGLMGAAIMLCIPTCLLIPFIFYVTSRKSRQNNDIPQEKPEARPSAHEIFHSAFANHTFRCLMGGFSTCGFHMAIIEAHLFSQFLSQGIDKQSAAYAFSVYGVATVLGALLSGYLCTRLHKGKLLTFYYGFRAVWVAAYLLVLPKTFISACLFSLGLGFTGAATVPPTSGLVNSHFQLSWSATLIGFLFLCHQIGAFLSASLCGIFVNMTGSYIPIWSFDIALCSFASFVSFKIK